MRIYTVDAFADSAFGGNPAAVCLLESPCDTSWMQTVAAEMNLSETAFLLRIENGFSLRWFTPAIEVELCGHATLASAHVLWHELQQDDPQIRFHTKSGELKAVRQQGAIELDFPATPAEEIANPPAELLDALGVQPTFVGRSSFDKFVVVENEETVRGLTPDFDRLRSIDMRGVIVTSTTTDRRFDFISRYFAPAAGINEDPVTGSAHCCLAPFWCQHLGSASLTGFQASARGGVVRVQMQGDRVLLGGQAVTVLRGELTSDATAGAT